MELFFPFFPSTANDWLHRIKSVVKFFCLYYAAVSSNFARYPCRLYHRPKLQTSWVELGGSSEAKNGKNLTKTSEINFYCISLRHPFELTLYDKDIASIFHDSSITTTRVFSPLFLLIQRLRSQFNHWCVCQKPWNHHENKLFVLWAWERGSLACKLAIDTSLTRFLRLQKNTAEQKSSWDEGRRHSSRLSICALSTTINSPEKN